MTRETKRAAVWRLHCAGSTVFNIADALGISDNAVRVHLREARKTADHDPFPPHARSKMARIVAMLARGETRAAVMAEFGVTSGYISVVASKWKRKSRNGSVAAEPVASSKCLSVESESHAVEPPSVVCPAPKHAGRGTCGQESGLRQVPL